MIPILQSASAMIQKNTINRLFNYYGVHSLAQPHLRLHKIELTQKKAHPFRDRP